MLLLIMGTKYQSSKAGAIQLLEALLIMVGAKNVKVLGGVEL